MIGFFQAPWLTPKWSGVLEGKFNLHSLIVLIGGVFIIYTAMKEIYHMIAADVLSNDGVERKSTSSKSVVIKIVLMNLVFSFDSILSAIALTAGSKIVDGIPVAGNPADSFLIMMIAIVVGGLLMILLADRVSEFLQRNRMYEVLGLFILFIVGVMLVSGAGLNAYRRPLQAAVLTAGRLFALQIPIAIAGSLWLGLDGIFAAVVIADVLACVASYIWLRRIMTRENSLDTT